MTCSRFRFKCEQVLHAGGGGPSRRGLQGDGRPGNLADIHLVTESSSSPAGWYPDPGGRTRLVRWWTGEYWTAGVRLANRSRTGPANWKAVLGVALIGAATVMLRVSGWNLGVALVYAAGLGFPLSAFMFASHEIRPTGRGYRPAKTTWPAPEWPIREESPS